MKKALLSISIVLFSFIPYIATSQVSWDGGAATTSWGDAANWNPDGVPVAGNTVTIGSGFTVVVDNGIYPCASITFSANSANTLLQINTGGQLNVTGAITYNDPTAGSVSQTIAVDGTGVLTAGSVTMANTTNATETNNFNISTGTVTISGTITANGAIDENYVRLTGAGNLNLGGTFTGGTFTTAAGSTVRWFGDNTAFRNVTYHHLTLELPAAAAASRIKASGAALTINGNLLIESLHATNTLSLNASGSNLTVAGNTLIRARGRLIDDNNGGVNSFQGNVTIEANGEFSTGNNSNYVFQGNITNSGLFSKTGVGTVTLQTNPLTITNNSASIMDITGAMGVNVNTTLAGSGVIRLNSAVTLGSGVTLDNTNTEPTSGVIIFGTLNGNADNSSVYINRTLTNYRTGTQPMANGTLNTTGFTPNTFAYSSAGAQSILANAYHHLICSGGGSVTKTLVGNASVNGDFTLATLTFFNPADYNFSVTGATTLTGTYADATVPGTTSFANVNLSGGTISGGASGVVNISGTLTLPTVNATIGNVALTVSGTATVPAGRTITINNAAGAKIFNGLFDVSGIATITAAPPLTFSDILVQGTGSWLNTGNASPTIAGNLTVNTGATFTQGTGTYTFSGTTRQISGTIASISMANMAVTGSLSNNLTALTVTGTTTVTNPGTFTNNTLATLATLAGTGTLIQGVGATLNLSGNPTISLLTANANPNTVNYNGAAQNVIASNYHHLILGGSNTKTLLGNSSLNGDFTLASGVTFNPADFNFSVSGAATLAGIYADATVPGTTSFVNVNLSGGSIAGAASGVVNLSGTLTHPTGNATIGTVALTVSGTTTVAAGRTLTINSAAGAKIFNGLFDVSGIASITAAPPLTFNDILVQGTGSWSNTGNASPTIAGNLTVNTGATFTQGTGTYTFSGATRQISGTIASLSMANVAVTGSLSNNLTALTVTGTTTVTNPGTFTNNTIATLATLAGTGTLTQGIGATLNLSASPTISNLGTNAIANTVNYNGAGNQNVIATNYYNLTLSGGANTKTMLGNTSIAGDLSAVSPVNFSMGTVATTLTVTGNSTINGTFTIPGTTAKTVTISGNLTGTGTMAISSGSALLLHQIFLEGATNSLSGFTTDAFPHRIHYSRNGSQSMLTSANYRRLTISGSGTKSMAGNIATADTIRVAGGTLSLNSNTLTASQHIFIEAGAELLLNSNARLLMANTRIITNNGTFSLTGSAGNLAEVNNNGAGSWFYNQPGAAAVLRARYFLIGNNNGGLNLTNGTLDATNNLSDGTFTAGIGAQSIQLTGINLTGLPDVNNVVFNAGPTYNVSRTSGTGAINFVDATGARAGENFDNDNGNPGTLINWSNPSRTFYSNGNPQAGLVTSWTRNSNGTGPNPSSVTDGLNTLIVQDGHTLIVDNNGNLNVLRLQIGQGTSGTLRIGSSATQRSVVVQELLDVRAGATLNAGSSGAPAHILVLYGNMVNNGNTNLRPSASDLVNLELYSNGIISGTNSPILNNITFRTGCNTTAAVPLDINGNVFLETGSVFQDGSLTHTVAGNWSATGTGAMSGSGTIYFDGLVNTINDNLSAVIINFNNLIFGGAGAGSIQENIQINGNLTVTNNTNLTTANLSIGIAGNFLVETGSTYNHTANTTTFGGVNAQTIDLSGTVNFINLTFSNGGVNAKTVNGNILATGLVTISTNATTGGLGDHLIDGGLRIDGTCNWSGTVTLRGNNLYTGNVSNSLTLGTSSLIIAGNVGLTQVLPATSLTANINNNILINSGYLLFNNNTAIIGQPGFSLSAAAGTSIYVRGSNNFPTGFGTYNLNPTSWVRYDVALNQTIRSLTYGNLETNGAGNTKTVDGPLDVNGTLDLNGATNLDLLNYSHTFAGNIANNTNSTIAGSLATVSLDADDLDQIVEPTGTGNYTFNNLTISLNGPSAPRTKTFQAGCTILLNGNLNIVNNGGSLSNLLVVNLNNNAIGGSPNNFTLGEYCQLNTSLVNFGTNVTDNFSGARTLDINSTIYYSLGGAQTLADGFTYGNITFNGGNKTARGPLDINGNIFVTAGTPVFFDAGFNHTLAGNWILNNAAYYTAASATGTITFDGSNQSIQGVNFNNVVVSNSGILDVVTDLNIYGNLIVNPAANIDFSVRNLNMYGNLTVLGNGLLTQTTGTTTFLGTTNQTLTSNSNSYLGNLIINKPNPAGLQTLTVLSELHVNQNTRIRGNAGVLDIRNQNVYLSGNLRRDTNYVELGQTFLAAGSNLYFDGADAQYIYNEHPLPLIFNNMEFSGAGDKAFGRQNAGSVNMEVNGNFTISGSTVSASGGNWAAVDLYVRGNWDNTGTFQHNRTVFFDGVDQDISASSFYNVNFANSGTKTLSGNITANQDLIISGTATLDASNSNITVNRNWDNTAAGAVFVPRTGRVFFQGGTGTIFTGTTTGPQAGKSFYDVEIGRNANTAVLGGDLDVNNDLIITSGIFQTNAFDVWLAGNLDNQAGTISHNNDASIITLDAAAGNYSFNPNGAALRGIVMNSAGAEYRVRSNFSITNVNFVLNAGTFVLNRNTMTVNSNNRNITLNGGTFFVDTASTLDFAGPNQVLVNNGGNFRLVGTAAEPATVTRNTGTFAINQSAGLFEAQHYNVRNGNITITGGTIDATNNFSNGFFLMGAGNAYLTLTGLNFADFNVQNVVFTAGPTYNVSRTSGTGVVTFQDASGSLAGENFDQDNANPGTLILWTFPAGYFWDGGALTENWHDANNWSGNLVPGPTDIAYLDHTFVPGPYTVRVTSANAEALRILLDAQGGNAISLVQENGFDMNITEHLQIGVNTTYSLTDNTTQLSLGGNWANSGTFNNGNSTVNFIGTGGNNTINSGGIIAGRAFYNMVINAPGTNYSLSNPTDINNNLTVTEGTFNLASGTNDITVAGNWFIDQANGAVFQHATADVTFDGTNQSIINGTFYNLLTAGSGTKTLNSNIDIDNNITIGVGTSFNAQQNNVYVGRNWVNNGAFSQTSLGTVIFDGTAGQNIDQGSNATSFNHLSFFNGGGKTFFNNSNVAQSFTINGGSGTVNLSTFVITGTGASNVLTNFGVLELRGANNFPVSFETISMSPTSWVYYQANINQDVFATTYGNLLLRGVTAVPTTKRALGNLVITGSLDIDDVDFTVFDVATNQAYITLSGNLAIRPGCDIIWGTGNSTLEHVGGDWGIDADLDSLNHLILGGTGDKWLLGNLIVGGNVTVKTDIDFIMYQYWNNTLFRTMQGLATRSFTIESGGRVFNATPDATDPAIPQGFGTYNFAANSSYYLSSPAGVNQTLFTGNSISYGNLIFNNIKNVTSDGLATLDVNGDLIMNNSVYFDNGRNTNVAGPNIYLTYYTPSSASILVTLDGFGNQFLRDDWENILLLPALTLSGSGVKTIGDGNDAVIIDGDFTNSASITGASARNIAFNGTNWNNNGIFTHTGGTLTFSGAIDQTINPGPLNALNYFNNVAFSNATVKTFTTNGADINGSFTINAGTVDLGALTHYLQGSLANTAGGSLLSSAANLFLNGGGQNINTPAFQINDITCQGTGTKYMFSNWTINGNLLIQAGTTLNTSDNPFTTYYNIFIRGNWTNQGTFTVNTSTVTFDGASGPVNIASGGSNFYDVVMAPTAGVSYLLQSPSTRFRRSLNVGNNATLSLNSNSLILGSNLGAGKAFAINGILTVNQNASLLFNNQGSQSVMNINSGGQFNLVGSSSSSIATLSREIAGVAGAETQINVLAGGTIAARYYLIEHLQDAGMNLQSGSILDATNNFSDGTWSNIRAVAGVRYLTLESNYGGGIISNITFNFAGTPVQGSHYNVRRETAASPVEFSIVGGNLGGFLFEDDEEAIPSATTGLIRWPSVIVTNWTGAVNTNWHLDGNWDNGVPTITVDAIIPDRSNDPIISNADAVCKNLTITTGTLVLDNNRILTASGDISIGTGTNVGILSVNTANSTIFAGGLWTRGANGLFLHGNGTVVFNSGTGSSTILPRSSDFYNVVFDNAITSFYLSGTPINFRGNFEVLNGNVIPTTNNYFYNVAGVFNINGGLFYPTQGAVTAGRVTLNGANQTITNGAFFDLVVAGTGNKTFNNATRVDGVATINSSMVAAAGCNIDFNGNFYLDAAGSFNDGNETHTFSGLRWDGFGTYTGNGTIVFDRTVGDQSVFAGTFHNLDINCPGLIWRLRNNITVNGNFILRQVTNYAFLYDMLISHPTGTGTFTLENNSRIYVSGTNNFPKGFASYNMPATTTVYYWGSINQNVDGLSYGNLILNNNTVKTLQGDIEVKGSLTFNNATLDVSNNNYAITLSSAWNNGGTGNFLCRQGEVILNGTIAQNITFGALNINDFYTLTINNTGFGAVANNNTANDFEVLNNLLVPSGYFNANGRTIYISGDMLANGAGSFTNNTGTYYLNRTAGSAQIGINGSSLFNLTINSGATYTAADAINLIGDFNLLAGTFNGNGNIVNLGNGNSDVINIQGNYRVGPGGLLGIGDGTTLTVASGGSIEVVGNASSIARVSRNASGNRYNFNVDGNIAARYYLFEYMSSGGINLSSTALIDPVNNFSDGTFTQGANSGQLLRIENNQNFIDPNYIHDVAFPINPGGSAANVTKTGTATGVLEFYNATGLFAGETYDNDPFNIINWTGPIVLTWNGSVSTDWFDSLNWTANFGPPIVPTGNENVFIVPATNQPLIDSLGAITGNLTIQAGAFVILNTPADGGATDLDINGDLTISGGLQANSANDYITCEGSWTRNITGSVTMNGNVTFDGSGGAKIINNRGIAFSNLTIAGTSQYQLGWATTLNGNLTIASGSTFSVTPTNFALNVAGNWLNNGTFLPNTGKVTFNASSGSRTINAGASAFYDLDINAPGVIYTLSNALSMARNLNLISGTLDLQGQTLHMGDGGVDNLTVTGTLMVDAGSVLNMANSSRLNINSGGTLSLLGTSSSNLATITSLTGGRYIFNINAGGNLAAQYYQVAYTNADGLYLRNSSILSPVYNLSDGIFSNGFPASGTYLRLENEMASNDTIRNVTFNTGPLFNVSRLAGTTIYFFEDAAGPMGTFNFENDQGGPDALTGYIRWPYLNTNIWTGATNTDWHNSANWSAGSVPDITRNAIIPATATFFPNIASAPAFAKMVTVNTGASLTISQNLTIAEDFFYQAAVTAVGSPVIEVGGNWSENGGSFVPGTSTVRMTTPSGNLGISLINGAFYNLIIDAPGAGYRLNNALVINQNLTVANGTLNLNGFNMSIGGSLLNNGQLLVGNRTITFNGSSGSHTINTGSSNLYNLTINSSGTAAYRLAANTTLSNNFTLTAGSLDLSPDAGVTSYNLTVNNRWVNTAGTFNARAGIITVGENWIAGTTSVFQAGTSTVRLVSASGTRTLTPRANNAFYNLQTDGAAAFRLSSNMDVNNNLTINAGTLDVGSSPSYNINLGGNWVNNSIFEERTGIVVFDGTSQSISSSGTETFYNFTSTSANLVLNNNVRITNVFNLNSGFINAQTNQLTLGTSTLSIGILNYTAGRIGGVFERWVNAIETDYLFPLGTSSNQNPLVVRFISNLTAGSLASEFLAANPGTAGLPVNDGLIPVDDVFSEGYWRLVARNSLSSNDYNISVNGSGFTSQTFEPTNRILKRTNGSNWGVEGTHVSAIGTTAYRHTLTSIATTNSDFCIGVITCIGGTIGDIDTVCAGDDLVPFINYISPTGGTGYTYVWQLTNVLTAVPGDANWTNIPASNVLALDYGVVSDTTLFVRRADATGCGTTYSNTIQIVTYLVPQTGPGYHISNDWAP